MPPVWNQRAPCFPKIASQSTSPGSSCDTAVCPRSEHPRAARTPKPRSVKLRPLRAVRPTPSSCTQRTWDWSTPPWKRRSWTRRPTGLSTRAVTTAVSSPKQRFSPRATLYSPPPSKTWKPRVVWMRPSPGSRRSMTSPRLTRSQRQASRGLGARAGMTGTLVRGAGAVKSPDRRRQGLNRRPCDNPAMRRSFAGLALGLGLALLAGLTLAGRARRWFGRVSPNLLLVSIDTLRADHLGCYGYAAARPPTLDALAASGLRFAQATTVMPLTLPAHSSLLTGTFPAHHGVRDNGGFYLGDQETTLAEVLREKGYRTGGFVGAFVLDSRWGIAQGFERYFDDFDLSRYEGVGMDAVQRRGDEVVAKALEWLAAERERPFFAWVHLYDPHTPYDPPEPYRSQFPATLEGAYDGEIAWSDALVGRLLAALREDGRLESTVLVVVGDHGESLGEHREQTHGFFVYDATVHIPMIMAGPRVPARAVAEQVRIVDVMPTALDLLGVPVPKAVQGKSLLPLARGESLGLLAVSESWYPRYHYGWSELKALRDGRYKLIDAPRRELYDLARDGGELADGAAADPARSDALAKALRDTLAGLTSASAAKGPQSIDPEAEERLQALGYLGGGGSRRNLEERPRGDPKGKIGLSKLLKPARQSPVDG